MENAVGPLTKVGIKRNEKGLLDNWKLELVRYILHLHDIQVENYFVLCFTLMQVTCINVLQEIIKVREGIQRIGCLTKVILVIFRHGTQFFRGYYVRDAWATEATFSKLPM